MGDHHLDNCAMGLGYIIAHNSQRNALGEICRQVGLTVTIEPRGLLHAGQGGPDVLIHDFPKQGQKSIVDVSLTSVTGKAVAVQAAYRLGAAAGARAKVKLAKYALTARDTAANNWAYAVEIPGCVDLGGVILLERLADRAVEMGTVARLVPADAPWVSRSPKSYIKQRMAVSLHKARFEAVQQNLRARVAMRSAIASGRVTGRAAGGAVPGGKGAGPGAVLRNGDGPETTGARVGTPASLGRGGPSVVRPWAGSGGGGGAGGTGVAG